VEGWELWLFPIVRISTCKPRLEHSFAQAALFQKILFLPTELLVEQEVGLVNQADGDVGNHLWWTRLQKLSVKLESLRGFAAKAAHELRFFGVFVPNGVVADAEVVAVVGEEFFEAGSTHAGEF